jgi:hypothetical protein
MPDYLVPPLDRLSMVLNARFPLRINRRGAPCLLIDYDFVGLVAAYLSDMAPPWSMYRHSMFGCSGCSILLPSCHAART